MEEAAALQRELAEADPDSYRAELAEYLSDLGIVLHAVQRLDAARTAKEELDAIQRALV